MKLVILLVLVILYVISLCWQNKENIEWIVTCYLQDTPLESIPTNSYILSSINQIIDSNLPNLQEYTFVDFGSGSGRLVKDICYKYKHVYGIELEEKSHHLALDHCQGVPNITLLHQSITDFEFPDTDILLYMYDPLYLVDDCDKVKDTYQSVLDNLSKTNHNKYILYVSGIFIHSLYKTVCNSLLTLLHDKQYTLVHKSTTNLFPFNRQIYLFRHEGPSLPKVLRYPGPFVTQGPSLPRALRYPGPFVTQDNIKYTLL